MKSTTTSPHWQLADAGWKTAVLAVSLSLLAASAPSQSSPPPSNSNRGIAPINSKPYGKAYGEWSGAWWRWAYSIPADVNPLTDPTGRNGDIGQSGPVWFLAGNFGGESDRAVVVPAGKALFFPIANQAWVNTPAYGDNPWSPAQEAYARNLIKGSIDAFVSISCEIDGRPVANLWNYRCQTPPGKDYMINFPENNVWGVVAGIYGPSVDDGYWLMLDPLRAGGHTIHFAATNADNSFSLDVSYQVNVVEPARVIRPGQDCSQKDYEQLSAAWWEWAMEQPMTSPSGATHPFVDAPTFEVTEGQSGRIWNLASPFGTMTRSCSIPAGKALFVGMLNAEASDLEGLGATKAERRTNAKWQADHIVPSSLSATIDGVSVKNITSFRALSPQFDFNAPTPWIFGATGGLGLAVADGYYLLIAPPSAGPHRIHYTGAFHFAIAEGDPYDWDGPLDMVYNLTVVPKHSH